MKGFLVTSLRILFFILPHEGVNEQDDAVFHYGNDLKSKIFMANVDSMNDVFTVGTI
jgi:hypothetical protein